jgi:hypothetical protein
LDLPKGIFDLRASTRARKVVVITMPNLTIVFGAILTGLGLFGYFGSNAAEPSVTALIPAFVGVPLALCGFVARQEKLRMHAMHAAVLLGLIGAVAAGGRGMMKLGTLISDDPTIDKRPVRLVFLMAALCLVYVVLCVWSFIQARRRRVAGASAAVK